MRKENSNILRQFFFSAVLLFSAGFVFAQDPVFTAIISSSRVVQNSVFEVQLELSNASGDNFTPPNFADFKVVGGPSIGSSTMIVNGQVSRSQSWTYSLLAHKAGNFVIGSATVVAGRRKLATKPVSIEVLAAKDIAKSNADDPGTETVLLKAEIGQSEYFPGQQIILNYKLLFRENVQNVNMLSEDDYSDFFIQNFNAISRQSTYETINGVTYTARIIKSVALFAHQSGTYKIDPLVVDVGINAPYPGNQGFFTMRRLRNVQVASQPMTINVLPLPVPVPESFSGAVGQYTLKSLPGQSQITTDDDFSLRVEITGNGDSRRWDPPAPVIEGNFELYDPRILENILTETEGVIMHSRTIEYLMIPQEPGEFNVFLPFTFFDPATKKYETIRSDTIKLQVARGNSLARRAVQDTVEAKPQELRLVNSIKTDDRFWLSIPHLFLFGLIFTGASWGMIVTLRRRREERIPESEKIRSAAGRHARHQLDQLNKLPNELSEKEFFEKATEIYYRFLSDKFNIPPADLDKDKLVAYLTKANIPPDTIMDAATFFDQCLSVRYGGRPGGFTKEQMIVHVREMIDHLGS